MCACTWWHNKWSIFQMDGKSAFLNGDLKEEVHVERPPGFKIPVWKKMFYKLHKVFMAESKLPNLGMTKLMHSFSLLGFNCFAESNFYVFSQVKLLWLIILYVDDLLITRSLASKQSSPALTKNHIWKDWFRTCPLLLRYGDLSITW